ncbi:hypothetical protein ACTA71_010443 [Dictyostelium dimigraforme]
MDKQIIEILEGLSLNDEKEIKKSINIFCTISKEEDINFKAIKSIFPSIIELLKKWDSIQDHTVISKTFEALSSLIRDKDYDEGFAPYFIKVGVVTIILEILDKSSDSMASHGEIATSAMLCIGDLILESDKILKNLVKNGYLGIVSKLLLTSTQPKMIGQCFWTVSNIASIDDKLLQSVIDSGILVNIINNHLEPPSNIQYQLNQKIIFEQYWCISNSIVSANDKQFKLIISDYRFLDYLQSIKKDLREDVISNYYDTISQVIIKTLQVCQNEHSLDFYKEFIADSFITSILKENNDLEKSKYFIIEEKLTNLNNFILFFK